MLVCCQMTNFSDWLTNLVAEKKISPAELSRRMKKDPGMVSRMLRGERKPSPETLVILAKALEVPEREVLVAAGIVTAESDDVWVKRQALKLEKIQSPALRAAAESLLNSLAEQEETQIKTVLKPKGATK